MTTLETFEEPADFLAAARAYLAADPVLTTVVATVSERMAREREQGRSRPDHPCWWLVARDDAGDVVGAVMRTAPFAPHPLYVLPMPDDAAVAVARLLHGRGEHIEGSNGGLPTAVVLAEELALRQGGRAEVWEHTRLFELADASALVEPGPVPGVLRAATTDDLEICLAWFDDFHRAAAEQAGRSADAEPAAPHVDEDEMVRRIEDRRISLWQVDGQVVHLTGSNPPAFGVARIGPVYTPAAHRARGYASAAVAAVSRRILREGHRACLFTDQANPTSNRVYEALGYRPVVDMANVRISAGSSAGISAGISGRARVGHGSRP